MGSLELMTCSEYDDTQLVHSRLLASIAVHSTLLPVNSSSPLILVHSSSRFPNTLTSTSATFLVTSPTRVSSSLCSSLCSCACSSIGMCIVATVLARAWTLRLRSTTELHFQRQYGVCEIRVSLARAFASRGRGRTTPPSPSFSSPSFLARGLVLFSRLRLQVEEHNRRSLSALPHNHCLSTWASMPK